MILNRELVDVIPDIYSFADSDDSMVRIQLPVDGLDGDPICVYCEKSNGLLTFHDNGETIEKISSFGYDGEDIEDVDPLCIDLQKSANDRIYIHSLSENIKDKNVLFFNFASSLILIHHLYGNEIYVDTDDDL